MKSFKHDFVNYSKPVKDESSGDRIYTFNERVSYPSITTVIGKASDKSGLIKWRKRVGEIEANRIVAEACRRGTALHAFCELYLNNELIANKIENLPIYSRFIKLKPYIDFCDNIKGIELPMYSDKLGVAGTADLICEYKGQMVVIDFKTSTRLKKEEWVEDYFIQAFGYAFMFMEMHKLAIQKVMLFVVTDDLEVQIFEKTMQEAKPYIGKLRSMIGQFNYIDGETNQEVQRYPTGKSAFKSLTERDYSGNKFVIAEKNKKKICP